MSNKQNKRNKQNRSRSNKNSGRVGASQRPPWKDQSLVPRFLAETMPLHYWTTLRYSQRVVLTSGTEFNNQVFSINAPFAPGNLTTSGTKHQPKGFDQIAAYYYTVMCTKTTITAVVVPLGTAGGSTGFLNLALSDLSTVVFTSAEDMVEETNSVTVPYGATGSDSVSARISWDLSKYVLAGHDVRSALGGSYSSLTTASPTDVWFCSVGANTQAIGGALASVTVDVVLDMSMLFTERRNLAQS